VNAETALRELIIFTHRGLARFHALHSENVMKYGKELRTAIAV